MPEQDKIEDAARQAILLIEYWKELRDCERFIMFGEALEWSHMKDDVETALKSALANKHVRDWMFAKAKRDVQTMEELLAALEEETNDDTKPNQSA